MWSDYTDVLHEKQVETSNTAQEWLRAVRQNERCTETHLKAQPGLGVEHMGGSVVVCRKSRVLFVLFALLGGALHPAPKRITRRLILSYKRLTLVWLVSCQLLLNYIIPSSFSLWVFPILILLNLILTPWIAVELSGWPLLSSYLCGYFSEPLLPRFLLLYICIYIFFLLPASLSFLSSCLTIAIQSSVRPSGGSREAKYHSCTELNKCHI